MSMKRKQTGESSKSLSQNKHFKSSHTERRAGSIKCMTLRNFMCHSLLEVEFKKNVIFLTGRNGSGKSAILTALVVGLGAKASLTNRGSNVKGFIKTGQNSAYIEITLYNKGFNSYKQKEYGDFIRIQRNFTATGCSYYKVKTEHGKLVSQSAKEVQNIVSYLGIQVENPVCILNQDTARNFLSTSNPKHKFQLFMRATKLDVILKEREKFKMNRRMTADIMTEKEEQLEVLRSKLSELKRKYEEHLALVEKRAEIHQLQGEMLWSVVQDNEFDSQRQREAVEAIEEELKGVQKEASNGTAKYEAIDSKINDLQRQIVEIKEAIEVEKVPEQDTKRILAELRGKLTARIRKIENVERTMRIKTDQCAVIAKEIKNVTENMKQEEEKRAERERNRQKYREEVTKIENMLETAKNDLFNLKSDLMRQKEEQETQLRAEITQIDENMKLSRASLETFQRESNNSLATYGTSIMQVVSEINARKGEFKHLPRGPFGAYITLKDKKWAAAVEHTLGVALLRAFAVDNEKDNAILMNIFRKFCGDRPPMLLTSKFFFEIHDVTRYKVNAPHGCMSVFDVLNFTDPVVANCVIDQLNVESVLLVPNDDVAINLLSESENVPKNCKFAVTLRGDTYYPSPNYRMYSGNCKQAKYLQVDTSQRIEQLSEHIDSLKRQKQSARNQYNLLLQEKEQHLRQKNDIEAKIRQLRDTRTELLHRLDEFENILEHEIANVDDLKNEMEILKTSLTPLQAELEKLKTETGEIREEIREAEERSREITYSIREMEQRIAPLELQVMKEQGQRSELQTAERFAKNRLAELKESARHAQSILADKEAEVKRHTENALAIASERPENIRPVPEIVAKINELQKSVRRVEASIEKPEELKKKYDELYDRYKKMSAIMKKLRADSEELRLADVRRKNYFKNIQQYFITYMKYEFEKVLEFRQFKGSMEVDPKQNTLELIVIPHQGTQGHINNSNLSGGERSFSTVAFLYALWNCMNFPFYILDEFDVYMDKLNRTKAMEILMYHAKRHPERLFVFLTPQDVSFINDEHVAVHKLADPERRTNSQ